MTMRRSTNGGGENSPMLEGEDDFLSCFLPDYKVENGERKIEKQQEFYL